MKKTKKTSQPKKILSEVKKQINKKTSDDLNQVITLLNSMRDDLDDIFFNNECLTYDMTFIKELDQREQIYKKCLSELYLILSTTINK